MNSGASCWCQANCQLSVHSSWILKKSPIFGVSGENVLARLWSGWTRSHPGADSTSILLFVGSTFLLPVDNRLNKSTHIYDRARSFFSVGVQKANLIAVFKSIFLIIYKNALHKTTLFSLKKKQKKTPSFFFFFSPAALELSSSYT